VSAGFRSVRDWVRFATSRFSEAGLIFGHGTGTALDEAVFLVLEALHLPMDSLELFLDARLSPAEGGKIGALIEARVSTRKPLPYLLNKAWLQGLSFYVDERVIVPRSFIAEILCGEEGPPFIADTGAVGRVLDLCTGSGCLAILAAHVFPAAEVDAVELSPGAAEIARRNIAEHGLEGRVFLHEGDLYDPLPGDARYDLIISNPPYVDAEAMAVLPEEYRAEPEMALAAGADGLDIIRRILAGAPRLLAPGGGLICEIGRTRPALEDAFPELPFVWLDTEESSGEVFWLEAGSLA
jgi:ribosomal protein L3 glutamine methyltransferase